MSGSTLAAQEPMRILLMLAALSALTGQDPSRAQSEIHLIPEGYVGVVTIAFRAANGEAALYESDARLYRIPKSGVLITQNSPNLGLSPAWRFFWVTADGTRIPIELVRASPVPNTIDNSTDPTIGIFLLGRGRLGPGRLPCAIEFDQYLVGTKAQLLAHNRADSFRRIENALASEYKCQ